MKGSNKNVAKNKSIIINQGYTNLMMMMLLMMICVFVFVWLENSTVVALFINQFSSSFFFLSTITFLESIVEHTHTRPTQSVFLSFDFVVRCSVSDGHQHDDHHHHMPDMFR